MQVYNSLMLEILNMYKLSFSNIYLLVGGYMQEKNDNVYELFINSARYDFIIGIFMIFIMYFAYSKYIIPLIIGLLVACINFGLNATITNYAFKSQNINSINIITISYFFRVICIASIGSTFYLINEYFVFLFCVGFCLHFISLILSCLFKAN